MSNEAAPAVIPAIEPAGSRRWMWLIAAWLLLPLLLLVSSHQSPDNLTYWLMLVQNQRILLAWFVVAIFVLLPMRIGPQALRLTNRQVAAVAMIIGLAGYAGHYWLLSGYDLSRDEQMASFDALIYGAGHLVWPLPTVWQANTNLLNVLFLLPVERPVAWVSGYLPGNAMLRALFAHLGDAALTGPVLNTLSMFLLWGCARRIWPGEEPAEREPAVVAVLLFALSSQVLMTGMTAYAMSAHLCCNLLWLWLFLRDRRDSDVGALAVGFIGTGLHQPLFHPLFVAPFMVLLLRDRRWGRLALFASFYALTLAFWFGWPMLTHALITGPHSSTGTQGTDYWTRLTDVLAVNHDNATIMAANLLHFVTWQHLLLLPLLLAGMGAARREPLAAALTAGFLLPIVVMTAIMPFQGHGFGYRYLHAVLGNAALLGGYGWRQLQPWHARLRPLLVRASMATLLVLIPLEAWETHGIYAIYARMNARIAAVGTDYIIIGEHDVPLALDLVLNRPDLGNRPIQLVAAEIDDADALAQQICHKGTTMALPTDAWFKDVMHWYGWPPMGHADSRLAEMSEAFTNGGCRVVQLR